ncbi:MAG: hypothetical protein N3A01_00935 [Bacteroidales bacterium]|nr:hypothetical protein [Bacteroidales bacterium]
MSYISSYFETVGKLSKIFKKSKDFEEATICLKDFLVNLKQETDNDEEITEKLSEWINGVESLDKLDMSPNNIIDILYSLNDTFEKYEEEEDDDDDDDDFDENDYEDEDDDDEYDEDEDDDEEYDYDDYDYEEEDDDDEDDYRR